jgi:hypothetical protein
MGKGIVALDMDGVLNAYMSGWQGPEFIEAPVHGAQAFARMLITAGYEPVVSSTRAGTREGKHAMGVWLGAHEFPVMTITHEKVPALLTVDDRAWRFDGKFPTLAQIEAAMVPWNRKSTTR